MTDTQRYNTGNELGSNKLEDLSDNAKNIDLFSVSQDEYYQDRKGVQRKTVKKFENEHDAQIAAHEVEHDAQMQSFENDFDSRLAGMAFTRVGTFTGGYTLTDMRQTMLWEISQGGDGHEYGWSGAFPKVVAAASTPATSGGIGAGAWVDRSDVTLRGDLELSTGAEIIRFAQSGTGAIIRTVAEKLSEKVSVFDFGAIGDGVTDDTAAIVQALATAKSVVFPPGTYLVTSTINIGTQRVLKGEYPQANLGLDAKSTIFARIADIGDGNAIFQASASGSTQAITFENLSFRGDKTVDASALSTMDATGLVGVNVRGVKQGTQFLNCAFSNLKSAVRDDIGSDNYLDKITFSKCFFTGMYLALKVNPTAGLSVDNCYFDECFDWIETTREVHLNSTRFNNTSFSSETCQIKARSIVADNVYFEGGNRWFRPTEYLSVRGSYFSESFSASGSTKFSCQLVNGNVTLNFEGVRVGTNTRLIDFSSGSDPATTTVRLVANSNGKNFGNINVISNYTTLGLSVEGYSNTQTDWNVVTLKSNYSVPDFGYTNLISDKPTASADSVSWTVANGRHRRSFYWASPGSTPQTKTITLRAPITGENRPGVALATITVLQVGNNSGYASCRVKQDRVVWLTEGESLSRRSANVTNVFEEFANSSGGAAQTSSTTVTAVASVDGSTANICTISVAVANTTLYVGKLLITVDVEMAFD